MNEQPVHQVATELFEFLTGFYPEEYHAPTATTLDDVEAMYLFQRLIELVKQQHITLETAQRLRKSIGQ